MISKSIKNHVLSSLLFILMLSSAVTDAQTIIEQGVTRLDWGEVEIWTKDYYGRAVAEKRNAAITISVVQDGEVLFQKAYGHQDYEKNIPTDATHVSM